MRQTMGELEQQPASARTAREALVGRTIAGRYVLRGLIGHGGMGAVYEGEHLGIGKRVAIKFVDPEFATDERVVARFAREARVMSAIESAHIVTVFDAGTEDGRPYLVMELLRGEDLGQRLRRTTRVPEGEALHIVAQVLKGLARAHAAGIVHRDLKPDNVFLVRSDLDPLFAKIVDFGISKIERPRAKTSPLALTGRGTILGTPFYMSPEQAQASSDVDARADLYSVGAILFECLSGRPPHTGESYEQVILSICMREAPDLRAVEPKASPAVAAFVARALSRDRTDRFSSAERMLAALHEIAPEERRRVPLDPPAPETLLSAGVARDSRPPREPEVPAGETQRLGSIGDPDVPLPSSRGGPLSGGKGPSSDRGAREGAPPSAKSPLAMRISGPSPLPGVRVSASSTAGRRRSFAPVIITASVATLLGIGVTFGAIVLLDRKGDGAHALPPRASTSVNGAPSSAPAVVPPASSPSGAASGAPSAEPSPSSSGAPATNGHAHPGGGGHSPAGSASAPGTAHAHPPSEKSASGSSTPPKPSGSRLDITRDLP